MPSHILKMLQNDTLPFTVMEKIVEDLAQEERKFLNDGRISNEEAAFLDSDIKCSEGKRTWGSVKGAVIGLDYGHQDDGAALVTVKTEWDDSCRGCHIGTYSERINIPDAIVQAYEAHMKVTASDGPDYIEYPPGIISDKWKEYKRLLQNHVEKVVVALKLKFFEADTAKREAQKEREKRTETQERELLDNLLKKYPPESK